jgi:Fic family protein
MNQSQILTTRAGLSAPQPGGYSTFVPAALPPSPTIQWDDSLRELLSAADRALGRLDGVASILPNPEFFVAMYVRHEAVLSSQIEGTQSTLEDVLAFESDGNRTNLPKDVSEVVNYVAAMNHGLTRLKELPLCLRLLKEIHEKLLNDVRGGERNPGEFRKTQNWIGPQASTLATATFVPPNPDDMQTALANFEQYINSAELPLLQCGIAHAQFETIHPFLDGNGRVGRLLITLLLCEKGILHRPLLYLSHYFKMHRAQYYDRLMAIRFDGDWEGWLKFFLRGVEEVSVAATDTARKILDVRESIRQQLNALSVASSTTRRLLDYLFESPMLTVRRAAEHLECTFATAGSAIAQLEQMGVVEELTRQQRNRMYRFKPYIDIFVQQTISMPVDDAGNPLQATRAPG